jgi:copper chaperone CopZ
MRALLFLPAALLLVACGDCDCCKKEEPATKTTAAVETDAERFDRLLTESPGMAIKSQEPKAASEAEPTPPVVKVAWRGAGDVLEFSVWHMRCDGCEAAVEEALTKLDVGTVDADHKTSVVTVKLKDPAKRDVVIAKVRDALKAEDFRVLGE